jgi:tetratricopeptide (TPR) repeat protein
MHDPSPALTPSMLSILEIWFTPSGVVVTFLLVVLLILLCAFFSPSAQGLIRQFLDKGVRGKWGSGEIEFGRSVPSKPAGELPAGEAAPSPSKNTEFPELPTSEIRPEPVNGDPPNSESALRTDMIIASFDRDHQALEKAYKALLSLPDRKESDESLTTDKLSLEHRMGDEAAVGKLARLADENPDWYEPCQSLASIYYSLGSYDKASTYLIKGTNRALENAQRLRSVLLDARIREKTEGPPAAIYFLKTCLPEFPRQRDQGGIWKRIAELHWGCG